MSRTAYVTPRSTLRIGALTIFGLFWIVLPFWFLIVNSFKTEGEASVLSLSLPKHWNIIGNFKTVIVQGSYFSGLTNSLLVAVPTILAVLLLGSMSAWIYARSPGRGWKFAYYASIMSILLPPGVIPLVYLLTQMHLNGSRLGFILALTGTRLGIVIFMATGFIGSISPDMEQAASLDGASRFQVYRHIILPMITPILFVGAVFLTISVWNEFFLSIYLLPGQGQATLPLTLYQFASASQFTLRWNLVFAQVILSNLPILILYLFFQKRVIGGLTEGALAG
jgi:raffinose/stachyose/melibiose transport system permease protein